MIHIKGSLAFAETVQVRFRLSEFDPEPYIVKIMALEKTHNDG